MIPPTMAAGSAKLKVITLKIRRPDSVLESEARLKSNIPQTTATMPPRKKTIPRA